MCGSTCFGRFLAHHQELTTVLAAPGFTVEAWRCSVVGRGLLLPPRSNGKTGAAKAVVSS